MDLLFRTAGAFFGFYLGISVFTAYTNPLRNIPGPWYSLWSDIVLKYHIVTGQKAVYVHALHQKYGPVVRISPSQADVCDIAAAQQIGKAEYHKTSWDKTMTIDEDNVFNTGDPVVHWRQRKLLSGPLTETRLRAVTETVDDKVRFAIRRISEEMEKQGGSADVFKWSGFLTTDVIAELTFGESFQMLEEGRKHQYFRDMEGAAPFLALRALFPIVRTLMSIGIPLPGAKKADLMIERSRTGAQDRLDRHKERVESGMETDAKGLEETLFTKLHAAGEKDLTKDEILSNAQLYIIAGSDTTSNALTYILWAVCKRPDDIKPKLLAELRALPQPLQYEDLRKAPYLNAVIDETLRLYASTPSTLPRHVPPEGAMLADHWFEGGTVVSTQAHSFHRDRDAFPDPEKFDPDRWENPTKTMRDAFVPFGAGARICLGLHLAMMELRLATARFFLEFPEAKVSTAEGMSDADMEQVTFFMAFPKGKRCWIQGS